MRAAGIRHSVRAAAIAAAVVMAAGCWPSSGGGPARQGFNGSETAFTTASLGSVTEAWSVQFGDGPVSDPVRVGGEAYVIATDAGHGSRSVYGVTPAGVVTERLDGQAGGTDRHYAGELVLDGLEVGVSSHDPSAAIEQRWKHRWFDVRTFEQVGSGYAWSGQLVARVGDMAVALNPNDASRPQPFSIYGHQVAGFEGWGGYVASDVLPTYAGSVFQSGYGLTNTTFPETVGNGVRSYPDSDQGTNCALEFMCPVWAIPLDGTTSTPVVVDRWSAAYVATDAGTVYALDVDDGATLWTASVGGAVSQPPALGNGRLSVVTDDGRLVVFASDGCGAPTCAPLWEATIGVPVAQPAAAGDVVFVATAGGVLQGFGVDGCGTPTCAPLWSADVGSEITGSPAISGGQLYVGTADGRLVAFAPSA
jgi:outer membrane protein assembly factor BamB